MSRKIGSLLRLRPGNSASLCAIFVALVAFAVSPVRAQHRDLGDITDAPGSLKGTITLSPIEGDWFSFRLSNPRFIGIERIHGGETGADIYVYRAPVSILNQSKCCANYGDTNLLLSLNTSDRARVQIGPTGNGDHYFGVTAGYYDELAHTNFDTQPAGFPPSCYQKQD